VTPTISDGGFTVSKARQTTVISLAALRRLRFPLNGASTSDPAVDDAARTALAALALCAASLAQANGADLRSRCQLHPLTPTFWEVLDAPPAPTKTFSLTADAAIALFKEAVAAAQKAGLPWAENELVLSPSPELLALVRKSQQLAATATADVAEA
jgi:CRISPR-associated protein Csb1